MQQLQLTKLHKTFDTLQQQYWEKTLRSVYGAGCISRPKYCFIFMNPTARNISCQDTWNGIRAPRIGLKQTRSMFHKLGLITDEFFAKTQLHAQTRTPAFTNEIYSHLASQWVYITNLAKCTQSDAKWLHNSFFEAYLPSIHEEIHQLQPEKIITFGNQVSSVLLQKPITVSTYDNNAYETYTINNTSHKIYPCRYPVGMWYRNIHKAIARIQSIL